MSDAIKKHNSIIDYERERKKMSGQSKKRSRSTSSNTAVNEQFKADDDLRGASEEKDKLVEGTISKLTKDILSIVKTLFGIIAVIVGAAIYIVVNLTSHGKDIGYLEKQIADINSSVDGIEKGNVEITNAIKDLATLVKDDHEIFLQLSSIDFVEKAYNIVFKDAFQIKVETIANEEYLADPLWGEDDNGIAQDVDSDRIYSPEDLYNTPIITSYMKDGNEIFFYGRFDENNRWNGKCILNTYSGDKLVSIYEGIYDKGTLYSYKRVEDKGDYWLVNDRVYQGEYNSGETWKYVKTDDFVKSFSVKDVKEKQIMTVDDFLKSKEPELLSYYRGNTANGLYNDNTGSAYLVSYFEDGELQGAENQEVIKTLYCGNFKDGVYNDDTGNAYLISYFENGELPGTEGQEVIKTFYQGHFKNDVYDDDTGNAWYITRQVDTKYMYYKGSFSRGNVDHIIETDRGRDVGYDYILDKLEKNGFGKYITQFWIEY